MNFYNKDIKIEKFSKYERMKARYKDQFPFSERCSELLCQNLDFCSETITYCAHRPNEMNEKYNMTKEELEIHFLRNAQEYFFNLHFQIRDACFHLGIDIEKAFDYLMYKDQEHLDDIENVKKMMII